MIACILVATDGSEASAAAVDVAIELTQSLGPDARLHVAAVVDYAGVPSVLAKHPAGAPNLLAEAADDALARAAAAVAAAGTAAQTHCLNGDVVEAILACATEVGADLLVAGFRGRNRFARLVMGSVCGQLVRVSAVPVLVVRGPRAGE
ncbi:MAG: universal stress protein [Candidatus Tumulicola sp.]